jgi:hypothetical protein
MIRNVLFHEAEGVSGMRSHPVDFFATGTFIVPGTVFKDIRRNQIPYLFPRNRKQFFIADQTNPNILSLSIFKANRSIDRLELLADLKIFN